MASGSSKLRRRQQKRAAAGKDDDGDDGGHFDASGSPTREAFVVGAGDRPREAAIKDYIVVATF